MSYLYSDEIWLLGQILRIIIIYRVDAILGQMSEYLR